MATVSSLGTGSGLDLAGLVDKLVAAEGAPATARLDRNEARIQAKLSAYGSLKGALSGFQTSIAGLSKLSTFQKKSVSTSSATDLFSVSASSTAIQGTYNVDVKNLAKAHSLATTAGQFTSNTDVVGTGKLTISFGTVTLVGDDVTNFDTNVDKSPIDITIDSSNNSLLGVRDAINNSAAAVSASIVDNGTSLQLVITSTNTGTKNSIQVTVDEGTGTPTDNADTTGLSRLAFNSSATNLDNTVNAEEALVVINGISISSGSNTLTSGIEGVTLKLLKEPTATDIVGVTVRNDTGSLKKSIETFVDNFNILTNLLGSLTDVDSSAKTAGILVADSGVRGIENQLRRIMGNSVTGLSGSVQSLSDLGIKTSSDGTLAIDNTKLQSAIDNNFNEINSLFAKFGVPTDSLVKYVSSNSNTKVGNYAVNVSQLATQGVLTAGSAIADLNITNLNDNIAVKINGVQSGTMTLTNKTYASTSELVAELQSQLNADSALSASGAKVTVAYLNSKLVITSDQYGSASTVEVSSAENNNLGLLSATTASSGVDVAGTIGGVAATGSGQLLKGAGNASGLQLQVLGDSTGSRGAINFTNGLAQQLDDLISGVLASDGFVESITLGFKNGVDDINEQREALGLRLSKIEARTIAQFSALDSLIAQLKGTSDFLTLQLESLPTIGSINRRR